MLNLKPDSKHPGTAHRDFKGCLCLDGQGDLGEDVVQVGVQLGADLALGLEHLQGRMLVLT